MIQARKIGPDQQQATSWIAAPERHQQMPKPASQGAATLQHRPVDLESASPSPCSTRCETTHGDRKFQMSLQPQPVGDCHGVHQQLPLEVCSALIGVLQRQGPQITGESSLAAPC